MPDVMIRNISAEDMQALKAEARGSGRSLQAELREVLHRHAQRARRRAALARMAEHAEAAGVDTGASREAVDSVKDAYGAMP
jgi:plasmid stability protein